MASVQFAQSFIEIIADPPTPPDTVDTVDLPPPPTYSKRELLEFTAVGYGEREMQQLDAQIEKLSDRPLWLPWWRDEQTLPVSLSSSDTTAAVATIGYGFVEGERAIIYQDPFTWEVVTLESVEGGLLTFAEGLARDWTAKACSIMPLKEATLLGSLALKRITATTAEVNVAFAATPTPVETGEPDELYRGIELLTKRADRLFDAPETAEPINATLDSVTGPLTVFAASRHPEWTRVFPWACHSRAEIAELEEFLARRFGRFAPFWSPTWSVDLELIVAAEIDDHEIIVRSSEFIQSEKHVAIITATGIYPFAIQGVTDNLDGTMTLRLWHDVTDPGLAEAIDPRSTLISFLKYVRLADDDVVIEFSAGAQCGCSLPLLELPYETP